MAPRTTDKPRIPVIEIASAVERLLVERQLSSVEGGSLLLLMAVQMLEKVPRETLHELLDECLNR